MPDNPKRVLLLAESPYMGGITSHILSIIQAFRGRSDFIITVAALPGRRHDNTLFDACRALDTPVHVFPMQGAFDIRIMGALQRFVRKERIDLVHTHNYRATLLCALAARRTPLVNTCHGMAAEPSFRLKAWQRLELLAMRRSRLSIAPSEFVRAWLIRQGLASSRVRTVFNGFEPRQEEDAACRDEQHIPAGDLVLLYIGRLVEGKGVEFFIEALAGRSDGSDGSDRSGVIVGDGPLRAALESQAAALGAPVRFVGAVREPGPYYRLADAVVLPSRMEALPMALIEAAAYGKPAIATRAGGIPEVVRDGESGMLMDYGDIQALRQAIKDLRTPDVRTRLGEGARAQWQAHFTLERMADGLAQTYEDALRPLSV